MADFTAQINKSIEAFRKKILIEFQLAIKAELVPKIVDNLMHIFDSEILAHQLKIDPARPEVARDAFLSSITRSLEETFSAKIVGSSASVSFKTGNINELLYNVDVPEHLEDMRGRKHPHPLEWLIFYLEGFIGDYAFISLDTLVEAETTPAKKQYAQERFGRYGWYGQGFMVPRGEYEETFGKVIPFDQVRHPFSGMHPTRLFERALEGVDVKTTLQNALKRALG